MPDLLVEAQRVVSTVIAGWHGRRRRGVGENFWQFRPFVDGEPISRIDWRRSAKDDHVYLRDREWEAAQTVWLWADPSPSMRFQSKSAPVSKESRAIVLVLALAEILSRSGERIGYPGVVDPISARNAAERIAGALLSRRPADDFPPDERLKRFSEIVIVSDLLDPVEDVVARIDTLGQRGIQGHVIMIADPAEETFPYAGRTEFRDPGDRREADRRAGGDAAGGVQDDLRGAARPYRRTLPTARLELHFPSHRPARLRGADRRP